MESGSGGGLVVAIFRGDGWICSELWVSIIMTVTRTLLHIVVKTYDMSFTSWTRQ
jgi:hypothetical protein